MNLSIIKRLPGKLKTGWGMLFRALFICSIGVIAYFWLEPLSIKDVPFAKLTLRQVVKFFSAVGIILYCLVWLFDFPVREREKDPYNKWAIFSIVFFLVLSALWIWLQKR